MSYFKQPISEEIFKMKYCLNGEQGPGEVFRGVAEEMASVEKTPALQAEWQDQFYSMLASGKFIPGGRILANARVNSPMKSYNNCFTIDIEDSIAGIFESLKEDAIIGSVGGGVGFNISKLRPKGAKLSKGGESSGVISFLTVFDQSARTIMTGGARRAAHIAILDVSHPDIIEFITCKQGENNNTLTQFNISVGITDFFMKAVEADTDWDLIFDGKVYQTVKAVWLYELLAKNAFMHNEPGVFNKDTVQKYNNGSWAFVMDRCNPCLTGDTLINTDTGIYALSQVVARQQLGQDIKAYSLNQATGRLELKPISWAGKTGADRQLIEIKFANGVLLKVTPEHKLFISRDQTMTAKEYLDMWDALGKNARKRGEYPHLVVLNRSMQNEHYIKVKASTQKDYVLEHHFNFGEVVPDGCDLHHLNEDTLDNDKRNLELLDHSEHSRVTNMGHQNHLKVGKPTSKSRKKHHGGIVFKGGSAVASVKWGGKEDVFDLTIGDNHNFFANNVLVHNCGEVTMPPYSLCCLGALNLTKFIYGAFTEKAYFDFEEFFATIRTAVRFLDNVLDATDYPLEKIEEVSKTWRRIGLGFTGLGNAFTMLGMKYGSAESKLFSERLGRALRDTSYHASIDLAKEKGAFPGCEIDKLLEADFIKNSSVSVQHRISKYGLRNIGINTVAPTGTISLSLGNNCSSGIEPTFALEYARNIRTGRGEETKKETIYDYAYLLYKEKFGAETEIPDYFSTTADIGVYDGLEIQAIFQKYIDHSISKTHNLKPGTTFEEYKDLFMTAYKKGLKGFTTFNPEGSMKGVLEYSKEKKETARIAPKRPEELPCDIHKISVKGEKLLILIGMLDGKPYELFVTAHPENFDVQKQKQGVIKKFKLAKGNRYSLVIDGELVVRSLSEEFAEEYGDLSRMLSMSLRHDSVPTPLQFIVGQLTKAKVFSSFSRGVARVLKKYIPEEEKDMTSDKCPECSESLTYIDGCKTCMNCRMYSKCD